MALTKIDSAMIAEGAIDEGKIANTVALGGPKISGLDYPGDDTAALPAGGQTIAVNGSGFQSGCTVFIDGTAVGVVSFLSESQLQFVAPAKATGLYTMYVVNPDGGTAILVPGMVYSGTPTWTTASGSLGTPYEADSVSVNFAATGDGALTYAVTSGSSLPTGLSLSSAGAITGTVPATANDTTYTFNIDVIDSENQSTTRQFSLTYKTDVVTWSSPAAGASFSLTSGTANTTSLAATAGSGKAVSFAVQSGTLPTGLAVSGSSITGTPSAAQANTAVTLRATAADTNRYADRTLYFTIAAPDPYVVKLYGAASGSTFTDSSSFGHTVSVIGTGGIQGTSQNYSGGSSIYFPSVNGNDNKLAVDISARNINFTTSAWTIGFWVNFITLSASRNLLGIRDSSGNFITGWIWTNSGLTMAYSGGMDMLGQSTGASNSGNWYHFRVTHGANDQYVTAQFFNYAGMPLGMGTTSTFNWSGNPTLNASRLNNIGYIDIGGYYNQWGAVNAYQYVDMIYMTNTNLGMDQGTIPLSEPIG